MLKTTEKVFFSGFFDEKNVQKTSIYLKYKSFCNIINVFIIIFDKIKASLLNKSIDLYYFFPQKKKKKYILTSSF